MSAQPERHTFPEPPDKTRTIGPGKKASGTVRMLTTLLTHSFFSRQCKVFVYSRIEYFDIFDKKALRFSEVCHEAIATDTSGGKGPDVEFRIVGTQNTLT